MKLIRSWWFRSALALVFMGITFLLLFERGPSWHDLADAFTAVKWEWVVIAIALIRKRFLDVSLRSSLIQVTFGGAVIVGVGLALGSA